MEHRTEPTNFSSHSNFLLCIPKYFRLSNSFIPNLSKHPILSILIIYVSVPLDWSDYIRDYIAIDSTVWYKNMFHGSARVYYFLHTMWYHASPGTNIQKCQSYQVSIVPSIDTQITAYWQLTF